MNCLTMKIPLSPSSTPCDPLLQSLSLLFALFSHLLPSSLTVGLSERTSHPPVSFFQICEARRDHNSDLMSLLFAFWLLSLAHHTSCYSDKHFRHIVLHATPGTLIVFISSTSQTLTLDLGHSALSHLIITNHSHSKCRSSTSNNRCNFRNAL